MSKRRSIRVNAPSRPSRGLVVGSAGFVILFVGALAYLVPPQVMLMISPYYGSTLFGVASLLALPFLLLAGGWRAPTNWIVGGAVVYGLLVGAAMESLLSGSHAVYGLRVLLEDALQFSAFTAGGCLACFSAALLTRLLRWCALSAFVSALLQICLMSAGAMPSLWGAGSDRLGSPSVYFACIMALCFGPAVLLQERGTWFGLALVGMEFVAGLASQTRTLLVNAVLILLLVALVDRSRKVPRVPMLVWIAVLVGAAGLSAIALERVADLRGTEVLDPTGRDEEFASMVREMTGPELVFGVGLGRGFVRYGFDADMGERESVHSGTHLLSGTFLVKLGVPIGSAVTVLAAWLSFRGFLPSRHRQKQMLPTLLLACSLVESALAGIYKPVTMFGLGAAMSLLLDSRRNGVPGRPRAAASVRGPLAPDRHAAG